jgi:hypothetical protein
LIREAVAKGDRYAHHSLRVLGCAYVFDLAADDPQKARQELRQDLDAWSYTYYDIQRANACLAGVDIALYERNPTEALHVINSEWSAITRSKLLRNPTTFAFTYAARARATLALASSDIQLDSRSRQMLLNEAEYDAKLIHRKGPPWARGLALLILAGAASCRSDANRTRSLLINAESALTAADLVPYSMAARWQLDATGHSVREWTSRQHIRRPEKIFAALAPGKWL